MRTLELMHEDRALSIRPSARAPDANDPNRLLVELELRVGSETFVAAEPCVSATDLPYVIRWLAQGADACPAYGAWSGPMLVTRLVFTDPYLALQIQSGSPVVFRVSLQGAFVPPFAAHVPGVVWIDFDDDRAPEPHELALDFPIGRDGLLDALAVVRSWAAVFPILA